MIQKKTKTKLNNTRKRFTRINTRFILKMPMKTKKRINITKKRLNITRKRLQNTTKTRLNNKVVTKKLEKVIMEIKRILKSQMETAQRSTTTGREKVTGKHKIRK